VEYFDSDIFVYHDKRFQDRFAKHIQGYRGAVYAPLPCKANGELENVNYTKMSAQPNATISGGLYSHNNCGTYAVALSAALGFKEIYLIGMDCCYSQDEKERTHFHPGYRFAKKKPDWRVTFRHMVWGFWQIGNHIRETMKDVNLYNCSDISLIDVDERYYEQVKLKEVLCLT
jgi:hypothetical protein